MFQNHWFFFQTGLKSLKPRYIYGVTIIAHISKTMLLIKNNFPKQIHKTTFLQMHKQIIFHGVVVWYGMKPCSLIC